MRRVAIGEIMTRNISFVTSESNLHSCAKEMVKNKINSIVILKGRKLIGIITSRDILNVLIKNPRTDLRKIKAIEVATRKVAVVKPSADISQALNKMKHYGFRRLPVIANGEIVGIIALKDILRVDPDLYNDLGELAEIREESEKMRKIKQEIFEQEGLCENCGALGVLLKVDGKFICDDCRYEVY